MEEKNTTTKLKFFGLPALKEYIYPYRWQLVRMVIIGILVSIADAIYPLFARYAINHFIGEQTLDTLPIFIGLFIATFILQAVFNYINVIDCAKMELFLNRDLRNKAFEHLQKVSLSYYNANNVGYIHARVMSDSGKIGSMVAWDIMSVVWMGGYAVIVLVIMCIINLKLALLIMAIMPIAILLSFIFGKRIVSLNRIVRELNSKITSDINEGITGAKAIKTLVIEDKLKDEFQTDTEKMRKQSIHTVRFNALFDCSIAFISCMALAVVMWRGGNLTLETAMEIGTFSVFMSYALNIVDPISESIAVITDMMAIQVNIERFLKLMATEGEVWDSKEVIEKYGDAFDPKTENFEELHGDIKFDDISFHYPDGEEMVLEHFDLDVPQGTSVAIVGETGAGKSTLVNLVCRFFEPTDGKVLIDGRDAKERSLQWLHSNIGYVLQTPHLFSGTIRDNLKYGNPDASEEEIMNALKMVSADGIVERQESGLDTEIGEGGDFLSTGEKQLLSIARAMLADPRILILDEATSSIDTETEQKIQQAINKVIEGRTSFVIAHRLSTIVNSDMILLVNDGKIVERGTHKELMKKKGQYYELYSKQFEAFNLEQSFN